MESKHVEILNIKFTKKSFNEMVSTLEGRIIEEAKTFVVTANPEIVMFARQDHSYNKIIESADYVVPDGNGIILASNILNDPLKERVTGFDLTVRLLEEANQKGWSVYLIGGKQEVNEEALKNIARDYPQLNLLGGHHGYFNLEDKEIPRLVSNLQPDIVLVALGFPRQEQWISKHYGLFNKGLFIGVGGSIDVLAGKVNRAPDFWIRLKLEWLYRLMKQPSRWRRMLALPIFVKEVYKMKIFKK